MVGQREGFGQQRVDVSWTFIQEAVKAQNPDIPDDAQLVLLTPDAEFSVFSAVFQSEEWDEHDEGTRYRPVHGKTTSSEVDR